MLEPKNEPKFRPLYDAYLALAEGHLAAGWAYTNALPRRCVARAVGLRVADLDRDEDPGKLLRAGNVLDPEQRIKVSRPEVKKLMVRSVILYPWPAKWRGMVELPPG